MWKRNAIDIYDANTLSSDNEIYKLNIVKELKP